MTTDDAAKSYVMEHLLQWGGRRLAVYNPHHKDVAELPVIYGFNNGGSSGFLSAVLLAEDGKYLGGHACSHEAYMPHDLGCLEGSRPDRHESFKEHYPRGYRMEFVPADSVRDHKGLMQAYELNQKRREEQG